MGKNPRSDAEWAGGKRDSAQIPGVHRPIGCSMGGSRAEPVLLDELKQVLAAIVRPCVERNRWRGERGVAQIDRVRPSKRLSALGGVGPALDARQRHVRKRWAGILRGPGLAQQGGPRFGDHLDERLPASVDDGAEGGGLPGAAEGLDPTKRPSDPAERGKVAYPVPGTSSIRFLHRTQKAQCDVQVRGSENTHARGRGRVWLQPIDLHWERDEPIRGHPASLDASQTHRESHADHRSVQ